MMPHNDLVAETSAGELPLELECPLDRLLLHLNRRQFLGRMSLRQAYENIPILSWYHIHIPTCSNAHHIADIRYLQLIHECASSQTKALSQSSRSKSAVGLFPGSRSRHGRIVRRIPRNFSRRFSTPSLPCSQGRGTRPAIASRTACLPLLVGRPGLGNACSPVSSSYAITPTAQISTAASTRMDLHPASKLWTVSGAA